MEKKGKRIPFSPPQTQETNEFLCFELVKEQNERKQKRASTSTLHSFSIYIRLYQFFGKKSTIMGL
ncbi:hypothetical protein C5B42_03230 [Candidatus Cerribacteria bacterium 'Amazon FNV 2010 28 9']|uniref:Uncharacterized protein n=1 Tax=Candidatus Cerribacteria bacterium 'Amazon FNV 2010 28 9' TaxID=2081795 RepID=A0A317JRD1_9BACT|nr:MAG: hypothetical protein C5B42_03230 [Candidatus Cerribacteria bacterium 'Amazon FNV 2010 28 9']